MSLREEVKQGLATSTIHEADSFVIVSLSIELKTVFNSHINFVDKWNVISEIERQVNGFYVSERRYSSGTMDSLTFRKHLVMIDSE